MAGRYPLPDSDKIVKGTFRPCRAEDNTQARPLIATPKPPRGLRKHRVAIAEWKRIAPLLIEQGTLAEVDFAALEGYCLAYERMLDAEDAIAEYKRQHGSLCMITPQGYMQQIPEISIASMARKECRDYMAMFGMSPSARTRIKVQKKAPQAKDPMEEILRA